METGTTGADLPRPPWRRAPARAARQQLSERAIVDAALRIMDAEGLDAVSMRRVAQALETGPASLYAHVRDKRDLHELMLEEAFRELRVPVPDPAHWQEQLKELAAGIVQVMLDRPGIARISMETLIPTAPGMLVGMDAMMGVLRAAGLPDREVSAACDALALQVTAYAYEQSLWPSTEAGRADAQRRLGEITEYLGSLPPDRLPHLTAMQRYFDTDDQTDRLAFALDVFVAGLASRVPQDTAASTGLPQ